jgi:hypothetical protein
LWHAQKYHEQISWPEKTNHHEGEIQMLGELTRDPILGVTQVDDIFVEVGHTGRLTPVALLTPSLLLGGIAFDRATLHCMDRIERLGVKLGD